MSSITPSSTRLLSQSFRYAARRNNVSSFRQLSITANCCAKHSPRQAPSIRRQEREQLRQTKRPSSIPPNAASNSTSISEEEAVSVAKLLATGYKSGVLSLPPTEAIKFLRDYITLSQTIPKPPNWEQVVCQEHNVSPDTLYIISRILNRHVGRPIFRQLAVHLILAGSALGHAPSTIEIVSTLLRKGDLSKNEWRVPLRALDKLVKKKDVRAMMLQGKIHEKQGRESEALALLDTVISSSSVLKAGSSRSTENRKDTVLNNKSIVEDSVLAEALVAKGKILLRKGDRNAAYMAFQAAAAMGEYPPAFYELGMLMEDGTEREECMKKAAESGITAAAYEVGVSMLETWEGQAISAEGYKKLSVDERRKWAKEWLFVAADGGSMESAKVLEGLFMIEGDEKEAAKWGNEVGRLQRLEKHVN